jgi:hypothetical protein
MTSQKLRKFQGGSLLNQAIIASAKKKNYFIVARIWSHAGRMANDETTPNSTLASIDGFEKSGIVFVSIDSKNRFDIVSKNRHWP